MTKKFFSYFYIFKNSFIHQKEMYKNFIAALLAIAQNLKQLK